MSLIADAPKEAPVSMMQPERSKPMDDACERAMKDIEGFKQQITVLKREEEQLGGQLLPESTDALSFATLRILVHLFSTKNCWPMVCDNRCARTRAVRSAAAPGPKPTTIRTGRDG